jgi:hypothetical protein
MGYDVEHWRGLGALSLMLTLSGGDKWGGKQLTQAKVKGEVQKARKARRGTADEESHKTRKARRGTVNEESQVKSCVSKWSKWSSVSCVAQSSSFPQDTPRGESSPGNCVSSRVLRRVICCRIRRNAPKASQSCTKLSWTKRSRLTTCQSLNQISARKVLAVRRHPSIPRSGLLESKRCI